MSKVRGDYSWYAKSFPPIRMDLSVGEFVSLSNLVNKKTVYLTGLIDGGSWGQVLAELSLLRDRVPGPFTLDICSQGGSLFDTFRLYDILEEWRLTGHGVNTRGSGLVASAAVLLLQVGVERVLSPNTRLLMHEVRQYQMLQSSQTATEAGDDAVQLKAVNDLMLNILAKRSTKTRDELSSMMQRRDKWLTAQEAVELGLADRVGGTL